MIVKWAQEDVDTLYSLLISKCFDVVLNHHEGDTTLQYGIFSSSVRNRVSS